MTDDTIRVRALDRELRFSGRDELADHVAEILDHRGGLFDPMELAAIRKLASVANGGAPERVHRIARKTGHHTSEGGRAERERAASPFGERIEELRETLEEAEAVHAAEKEELSELRDKLRRQRRTSMNTNLPRSARTQAEEEATRLRRQIAEQAENERTANRAAVRARAALGKARLAADRWRYDQGARFVITDGDERRTVDREGLLDWIDSRR